MSEEALKSVAFQDHRPILKILKLDSFEEKAPSVAHAVHLATY